MKLIERTLILAILLLTAAIVVNGFIKYPPKETAAETAEMESPSASGAPVPAQAEKPIDAFYKTPADDLKDPLQTVFEAKDELSMRRSLAKFKSDLPAADYEKIIGILEAKHVISSEQSETGKLELRFPSLLALKACDGKTAREILDSAK